jgi:hypothetical protein
VKVAWVHPSWRDLVIEHLAGDASARAHFLRHAAVHGVLLALSTAGGADGSRELPLLIDDEDWDALADRIYELVPELDDGELAGLLDGLGAAIAEHDGLGAAIAEHDGEQRDAGPELRALAATATDRVGRLWKHSQAAVPLHLLESWLAIARAASIRVDAAVLRAAWTRRAPTAPPALDDRAALERFDDWLALTELIAVELPSVHARLGFPDSFLPVLRGFLDVIWHGSELVVERDDDPVARALIRIDRLAPSLRFRARALLVLPPAAEARARSRRWLVEPPPLFEDPLPFDVERVLRDL